MMRYLILLLFVATVSCRGRQSTTVEAPHSRVFLPAIPPSSLSPDARRAYMSYHYWDSFDFADTLPLSDSSQFYQAYVNWVANYLNPKEPAPLDSLMHRVSVSKPMLELFADMSETIFNDPNSALRNDELYIRVLEAQLRSPLLDKWEKMTPEHNLKIARLNRLGELANDFHYTLASGRSGTLYGLQAAYTLIFINNPDCPMCKEVREAIIASPMLNRLIDLGRLKIVSLYTDEDLTAWRKYQRNIPAKWINGYDKGCVIRDQELYDLRAIPALYLLDHNKRVLLKDSISVPDVETLVCGAV